MPSKRKRTSFAENLAKSLSNFPYSASVTSEISNRRRRLPGLAIDRLLSHVGITDAEQLYPPKNQQAFLDLVERIECGPASRLFQSRALLYLFLDFSFEKSQQLSQEQTVGMYYASQMWISEPERGLVTGLWHIDHGKATESLEHLGQNFDLNGANDLHEYIVLALADQEPEAVTSYLAARGSPNTFNDQLVKSLAVRGKFAEVLDISRETPNYQKQYLKEITRAATKNKKYSLELAQLPCTPDEWKLIKDELNRIITTSSSLSCHDSTLSRQLASNVILVRALHTGDTSTLNEVKKTSDAVGLFV